MGRGVVSGLVWGLLVSALVLAAVSLSMPLPDRAPAPQPPAEAPIADAPADAPQAPEAVPNDQAPAPVVGDAEATLTEAPVVVPTPAPSLPQTDTAPPSATAPAAIAEAVSSDPVPAQQLPAPAPANSIALAPAQPAPAALPAAPQLQLAAPVDGVAAVAAPGRVMGQEPEDRLEGVDTTSAPAPMPAPSLDPVPEDAPKPPASAEVEPPAAAPRLPQVAPPATAPSAPMAPSPDAALSVPDTLVAPEPPPLAQPEVPAGALVANAVAFEAPQDQPLLSVVLIEDPANPLDPAIVSQITFPVSFALDPLAPEAAARAALLREAGFEVVILGGGAIPAGAVPADVEVALAAAQASLPQAVALIDNPASRIQGDRTVLEATVAALAASGHGLIAFPLGLNTAETTAQRDGVPVATAFRLLDDEDQRAPVITRYLDRAAFAAAQEGAVLVVGRIRPDTITAVFSWALGGRAEGIRLAPVSAVLTRLSE